MQSLDLSSYRQIVVLTGAGVSVASGLRPYRGPGGLWEEHEVAGLATAEALERRPDQVRAFFAEARERATLAEPNAAHRALARWEQALPADVRFTLITQNVDGLHQRAGSVRVIELHGSLFSTRCGSPGCGRPRTRESASAGAPSGSCELCGGRLRPDLTLFDEPLDVDAEWQSKQALRECDLFLAIGTSGTVSPASNFVRSAAYAGARTIFVNLEPMRPRNPSFAEEYLGRAEQLLPTMLGH
ncbi:MAG: Sir2 family NAD-dependent protein deacetylase [Myxococcales bacterium]